MSGIAMDNIPAFLDAQKVLNNMGYEAVLPKDMEDDAAVVAVLEGKQETLLGTKGMSWGQALSGDIPIVADQVQGIVFLPNWEKSRGARLEAYTGLLCNLPMWEYLEVTPLEIQLEELKHAYVAGVCAAQWIPKKILEEMGLIY